MVFNQRTVNPSFLSSRGKCFGEGPPETLEYHVTLERSKSIELRVRTIKVQAPSAKWRSFRWSGLIVRPQWLKLLVGCVMNPVCANIVFELRVRSDKGTIINWIFLKVDGEWSESTLYFCTVRTRYPHRHSYLESFKKLGRREEAMKGNTTHQKQSVQERSCLVQWGFGVHLGGRSRRHEASKPT